MLIIILLVKSIIIPLLTSLPFIILIIFITTLYLFTNEIRIILSNLKIQFSNSGVNLQSAAEKNLQDTSESKSETESKSKELKEIQEKLEQKSNEVSKHKFELELFKFHTETYDLIFGGQIEILKLIRKYPNNNISQFMNIYTQKVSQYPNIFSENWNYEKYVGFLYNRKLIENTDDNVVHLTPLGENFLKYIFEENKDTSAKGL